MGLFDKFGQQLKDKAKELIDDSLSKVSGAVGGAIDGEHDDEVEEDEDGDDLSALPPQDIFGVSVTGNLRKDTENNNMDEDDLENCINKMSKYYGWVKPNYKKLEEENIKPKHLNHYTVVLASLLRHLNLAEPQIVYSGDFEKDIEQNNLDEDDWDRCPRVLGSFKNTFRSDHWSDEFTVKRAGQLAILHALTLKYLASREPPVPITAPESPALPLGSAAAAKFCEECGAAPPEHPGTPRCNTAPSGLSEISVPSAAVGCPRPSQAPGIHAEPQGHPRRPTRLPSSSTGR